MSYAQDGICPQYVTPHKGLQSVGHNGKKRKASRSLRGSGMRNMDDRQIHRTSGLGMVPVLFCIRNNLAEIKQKRWTNVACMAVETFFVVLALQLPV